ncbi:hypothetical protein FVR03_04575 [Pontibacter qinzhouensis]|uniref:Uncharacterized protein n=1 Tax=Pontibacter qinzhouensis TaxID=2603253 RepID=A0A5C8KBQ0_9BACT|nr:hypothetical protein [Pontibacter qinzhouensis]TXK50769.1 hypothetical protein FVR03_04575 [Pontibacter qinzhouensis]
MKSTFTALLLLFTFSIVFSQSRTLSFKNQSLESLDRQFYIAEVIDSRPNKQAVGEVQAGL